MNLDEQQLRTVILAEAIETHDAERRLVTQKELDEAGGSAVAAARARGLARPEVRDIVVGRAAGIVAAAGARSGAMAALASRAGWLRALAAALPAVTFLLGFAGDRIANVHRVDLLSPPLLALLGWNLLVYLFILAGLFRSPGRPPASFLAARRWLAQWRGRQRGAAFRVISAFHARWHPLSAPLAAARVSRTLHLCAAAWALGFAASLLARGLIARYQFGWESTFLDARQVHAIVSFIFWPLTTLFGLAPFSLDEIRAAQDFPAAAPAGRTWVLLYAGLLALVVVAPRLLLAGWARWREFRLSRQLTLALETPYFGRLEELLWGDIRVGLVFSLPEQAVAMRRILRLQENGGPLTTAAGDVLRFVMPEDGVDDVDAVLWFGDAAAPGPGTGRPSAPLAWGAFGESWVQEPSLFGALERLLPRRHEGVARLAGAWDARNTERFAASMRAMAAHLRECQARVNDEAFAASYEASAAAYGSALLALHQVQADSVPALTRSMEAAWQGRPGLPAHLAGGAGAAVGFTAGAAAGAKAGVALDIGSGGATLGAASALGALIGGAAAWVLQSRAKQGREDEILQRVCEAAIMSYLVTAHLGRPRDAASAGPQWKSEAEGVVAARWEAFRAALRVASPPASALDALAQLLEPAVKGILQREFLAR